MAPLAHFFAQRFLFSPKSHSVINIISRVSMVAVAIPVAALVILISVFNGIDDLVRRLYTDFDPDMLIVPTEGKNFSPAALDSEKILSLDGVSAISFMLEESALLEYRGRQTTATVRGVDSEFGSVVPIGELLSTDFFEEQGAIVGQGIVYSIGIQPALSTPLKFYVPRRGIYSSLMPVGAFSTGELPVGGVFVLDADTDGEYVIVPLDFAQELFDYKNRVSGLMVDLKEGARAKKLKEQICSLTGDEFTVLSRYEQKASMYRIMQYEKWGVFFIGLMVLIIASFSIVGSLIMLIIDKRDNIRTLGALGAPLGFVRSVFRRQGVMIGMIGALAGLVGGVGICAVQQIFGVVPMPASTFLVDSYPVLMKPMDIAVICVAVVVIIYIITTFTVHRTVSKRDLGL